MKKLVIMLFLIGLFLIQLADGLNAKKRHEEIVSLIKGIRPNQVLVINYIRDTVYVKDTVYRYKANVATRDSIIYLKVCQNIDSIKLTSKPWNYYFNHVPILVDYRINLNGIEFDTLRYSKPKFINSQNR